MLGLIEVWRTCVGIGLWVGNHGVVHLPIENPAYGLYEAVAGDGDLCEHCTRQQG